MSGCPALASDGVAAALRAVDCMTGQATGQAFGRLFGQDGRLLTALTLLLTLYVALFAIGLLTGRTRIGLAALTPRMLTLGLVLTFATSWVAYRDVVWTLAAGAPDQVASIVTGTRGSATTAFADRLDHLFDAVQASAEAASRPTATTGAAGTAPAPATPLVGGFSASTVLWVSALMLLLGTVGVLVTSKIALAAMLALGPVFLVLALFRGTRGLFEGWLKGVVLFAMVPLFAVLTGGGAVLALDPVAQSIGADGGQPDARATAVLFLGSCVYLALLSMAVKAATMLVTGWRLPGGRERPALPPRGEAFAAVAPLSIRPSAPVTTLQPLSARGDERVRGMLMSLPAPNVETHEPARIPVLRSTSNIVVQSGGELPYLPRRDPRVAGLGSRFRSPPNATRKEPVA